MSKNDQFFHLVLSVKKFVYSATGVFSYESSILWCILQLHYNYQKKIKVILKPSKLPCIFELMVSRNSHWKFSSLFKEMILVRNNDIGREILFFVDVKLEIIIISMIQSAWRMPGIYLWTNNQKELTEESFSVPHLNKREMKVM